MKELFNSLKLLLKPQAETWLARTLLVFMVLGLVFWGVGGVLLFRYMRSPPWAPQHAEEHHEHLDNSHEVALGASQIPQDILASQMLFF